MEVKFVIINESLIMTHIDNSCQDDVFGSPVRSMYSDCLKLMNYEISGHRLQKKNIESGKMNPGLADNWPGTHLWGHITRSTNQTSAGSTVRVLSLSRFCPDFPENA